MEEKSHHASTQAGPPVAPKLEVTKGENKGETFKVKLQTKIGRERDNDVILLDLKASRHHAEINLKSGQWVIEDLGSANGTMLNGAPVEKRAPLNSGDRITLGETEMVITISAEGSEAPASMPTPKPAPVPTRPSPQTQQPQPRGLPRIAWIAGGVMVLVCFAAIITIYFIVNRVTPEDSVVENVTPPSAGAEIDPENTSNTPVATAPSDAIPTELTLAYEDDFSDSFGGWDDAFDTYTRKVYGNNRYQIEVTASNLVAWGLANRDVADFEMEVEARQEDGDEKSSYGLLFRFMDRENFYRFDVSGDGYYLLSKFIDGEWITLVDWTESASINPGQTGNVLKVSAFGPNITVWANGQQLASVTDDSLSHGNFGFFAGTFSEPYTWVSYDNLKLWTPPGEAITSIPTATRPSGPSAETAAAPTATPRPPTATATPASTEEAEDATEEATIEVTETATPTLIPTATSTPVPLPEYASRDQTLARGETELTGRIVFPVYDVERGVYDIYMANIDDGENLELVQQSASQPALTEDGAEIAYRSWQPDNRGLYARRLTEDAENAWGFDQFFESARPQFSPADRSLMYHSRTGGDAPAIYRVIDGVGQVMRREAFPIQGKSPKWSADGQQFVYSSCLGSDCGIILSNINGSAPVNLTNHPSDTSPEFSPDGSSVVFMSERAGNWEIYKVDLESGDVTALTSDAASDGLPTWSPDGSKIAFVSNRDGGWSIFTMDPDGNNKRRQFEINGPIDGIIQHDISNSFGWVEENIDWIP